MPTFNLGRMLEDQGLSLLEVQEDGNYRVEDGSGNQRTLNVGKMLTDLKLDRSALKVNDPDNPLDQSPVGLVDRAKMALGNTKGQVNYLKEKFDEVVYHPDNGMLVKNHGVWQKVDKSGMDPWELTKDIVEGAVGLVPSVAASTVGAVKGAAAGTAAGTALPGIGNVAGGIIGGIVGAGAGGGAAEGFRTSLGRLVGTYDATPEEQLQDIAWETILNAGGQTIGYGVKPTINFLAKSAREISQKAAPGTKELLSSVYGTLTGAGQVATRTLIEHPDDVVGEVGKALGRSGRDSLKAVDLLKNEQVGIIKKFVSAADDALERGIKSRQGKLLANVSDDFTADLGGVVKELQNDLVESGFGKWVPKQKAVGLASRPDAVDFTFRMNSMDDIEKIIAQGGTVDRATKEVVNTVAEFADDLALWERAPKSSGRKAAEAALNLKRALSASRFSLEGKVSSRAIGKLSQYSEKIDNQLSELFHNQGLGGLFDDMNSFYASNIDVIREARRVVDGVYDPEIFVNKLVSNPGSQGTAKGMADQIVELIGDGGKAMRKSLMVKESAKGHVRFFPNPGKLTATLGAGAGAYAVGTGVIGLPAVAAGATQASPRFVMRQVQYATKLLDFVKSMDAPTRVKWLKNPQVVGATLRTVLEAADGEEQALQQLLGGAGIR